MTVETFLANFGHLADAPNGVRKLRELILQLAVSGEFSKSLPKDKWKTVKLGSVLDVLNGFAFPSSQFVETSEGMPLIRIRDIKSSRTQVNYIGDYREEFIVRSGDYLIGMDGNFEISKWQGPDALLNQRVCRLMNFSDKLDPDFIYWGIREKLEEIHRQTSYVTVKHLSSKQIKEVDFPLPPLEEQKRIVAKVDQLMALCDELEARQQKQQEGRVRLNNAALDALLNAGDPADFSTHWQRICGNFDLLYDHPDTIAKLRAAILQLAVQGKLVPQDPIDEPASVLVESIQVVRSRLVREGKIKKTDTLPSIANHERPFKLPSGWEFIRLGNLTNRIGSGCTPRGGQNAYVKAGIPFLRSQNVWNHGLELQDVAYINEETHKKMSNTVVYPNDILLNITGASLGRCTIYPSGIGEANVSQHVTIIRPTDTAINAYLHICILSPYTQGLVWGRQVGMAREGLSKKVLEQFEIPLPPLAEQHRIVAKVDQLMALCDALEAKLNQARQQSEKLMEASVRQLVVA